ncbi:ArdC family protein [Photobacterium damselae]|uniref:ArdC family protein n=1 Tax=Photobacterium damselae TaxID=38293 RepID=UPI003D7EE33A
MAKTKDKPKETQAEKVANLIIKQIEAGTAPWQKPWDLEHPSGLPHNGITGNRYKGGNALYLQAVQNENGYDDPRWMTYKQAQTVGAQVRKGEESTEIVHYKFKETRWVENDDGDKEKVTVHLDKPKAFSARVFNAQQIDGLEPYKAPEITWDKNERAEALLQASQANIINDQADRAFYSPFRDEIHLPPQSAFPNQEKYYATALHELGHWTGSEDRLDRDLSGRFGSESYAKEELRAEIASLMIAQETGIAPDTERHASYVKSWVKVLQDDPNEITRAASDAEQITHYVLDFERTLEHELTEEQRHIETEHQINELAKDSMVYSLNHNDEPFLCTFVHDTDLGDEYQDIHNGIFYMADSAHQDNDKRLLASISEQSVIQHLDNTQTEKLLDAALEQKPENKVLLVFGDKETKQNLKRHEPDVFVMTASDIDFGSKSLSDAVKQKGVEVSSRHIKQVQDGAQRKLDRKLYQEKEKQAEKATERTSDLER